MGRQKTHKLDANPIDTQLRLLRGLMLVIPIYMFTLSPTSGAFGPSIPKSNALLGLTFAATVPGIIFSIMGILGRSNVATGISGAVITVIIVANNTVELYYTVFDFIVVLFYLEISTSLTTFSDIASSVTPGADENVSQNYRIVVKAYMRRLIAILLATLFGSLSALLITSFFALQVSSSGLAVLALASLMLVFTTLAVSYARR
jgi:hypothetical protein